MITEGRLAFVRQLLAKATRGPWWVNDIDGRVYGGEPGEDAEEIAEVATHDEAFIAQSRQLIPELVASLDEQQQVIRKLEEDHKGALEVAEEAWAKRRLYYHERNKEEQARIKKLERDNQVLDSEVGATLDRLQRAHERIAELEQQLAGAESTSAEYLYVLREVAFTGTDMGPNQTDPASFYRHQLHNAIALAARALPKSPEEEP
jgi:hypothetical protein